MNAQETPTPAITTPTQPARKKLTVRRGVVIVAVLLVITLLSLAAYQYADMMQAEAAVSENAHRAAVAKAFADSGLHYAAAMLLTSDAQNGNLNLFNNPQSFQGIAVTGDNGLNGYFSLIAPPDPNDTTDATQCSYGLMDECGKINLASWMAVDTAAGTGGQVVHDVLIKLPNMTEEIANNIVAYMGGTYGINNGGAGDDYYSSLKPACRCKNAPIDSIDELLLVKGVTRDLLYGADANRNGVQDGTESAQTSSTMSNNAFDRGWSAFLTTHSREQNVVPLGTPGYAPGTAPIYLNAGGQTAAATDLQTLYSALQVELGDDMAKFIIMARQYGLQQGTPSSAGPAISGFTIDTTKKGTYQIAGIFSMVNAYVNAQAPDPKDPTKTVKVVYASPLNDPTMQRDLLPKLFNFTCVTASAEIPARINVNTAPAEVLTALTGISAVNMSDADVQKIITTRPNVQGLGDVYLTPTWLLTEAQLDPKLLTQLDAFITTRSQVYRVQSVGYFANSKGPSVRLEAVIDTNAGRPRILAWRNLSELGKGWTDPNMGQPSTNQP